MYYIIYIYICIILSSFQNNVVKQMFLKKDREATFSRRHEIYGRFKIQICASDSQSHNFFGHNSLRLEGKI